MPSSTRQKIEEAIGLDKLQIVAEEIDLLRDQVRMIQGAQSVDELVDVIEVDKLAQTYHESPVTMRRKLRTHGGSIFKLGKKWVIRKVRFLEFLETLEGGAE